MSSMNGVVPQIPLETIEGACYCWGIAGIMGFKSDFHKFSVKMGRRLMERIKAIDPERLVSDCLSCLIRFNQLLPCRVYHPIEILRESYAGFKS